jgi:hypothetical protein
MLLKRIRKHARTPVVFDFLKLDKKLSDKITFTRADAAACAVRRRMAGAVGPSRTNTLPASQQFDDASWTKNRASITANAIAAPDGTVTADKLVEDTATGSHAVVYTRTMNPGEIATTSVHIKAGERTRVMVQCTDNISGDVRVEVDLTTGVATAVATTGNWVSATSAAGAVPLANGWYRVWVTAQKAAGANTTVAFSTAVENGGAGSSSYTGDGASGLYVWGGMFEFGNKLTPYIPTSGAAVTTTDWPRTNKCTNRNANPVALTSTAVSDPALQLSLVDDSAALARSPLALAATAGVVYKATNTHASQQFVQIGGTTGNLAQHTGSVWVRGGTGKVRNGYASGTPFAASTDYVRRTNTFTPGATTDQLWIAVDPGQTIYFILNQLEEGSAATAVIVNDQGGAAKSVITPPFGDLEVLNANEPRIDYSSDGSPRGLRVEPTATQLYRNTNDSTAWGYGPGIPAANRQTGFWTPDGYPATLLTCTAGSSSYGTPVGGVALTAGQMYYRALEVKPLSANKKVIFEFAGGTGPTFDLSTQTITGSAGATCWIDTLEDGWYRCNWLMSGTAGWSSSAFYYDNYGLAGAASQFIVGKPLLLTVPASNKSSFIHNPTGASVTRAAEQTIINALTNVAWNANGWSGVFEWEQDALPVGDTSVIFHFGNGDNSNFVQIYGSSAGNLRAAVNVAGTVTDVLLIASAVTAGTQYRMAVSLLPTGIIVSLNGGTPASVTATLPLSVLTTLRLGTNATPSNNLRGWLRRLSAWGRYMSPAELKEAST